MQVLPLQVASLALVSLPWTLPRLLDLQAASPAAVLDGMHCPPLISLLVCCKVLITWLRFIELRHKPL